MAIGDVVNTASRLQGVAPIGGIMVGEGTHRLTKRPVRVRSARTGAGEGKGRAAAGLGRRRPLAAGSAPTLERGPSTPFVGREDELELLKQTFARAGREPSVQLVTLLGEPGVGQEPHHPGVVLVHRRSARAGGLAARPVSPVRRGRHVLGPRRDREGAGRASSSPTARGPRAASSRVRRRARRGARRTGVDRVATRTPDRPGRHPGRRRRCSRSPSARGGCSWRRSASLRPLVIAIEDLHWATGRHDRLRRHLLEWSTGYRC